MRWYGLIFGIAFIVAFNFMRWVYLREKKKTQDLDRLLYFIIAGTVIGARLGHCIFYDPSYYLSHPLKVFAIWEGGLASHGGGLGVLVALYLYHRKTEESYMWFLDRLVIPAALVASFIRVGNFFNSEIIGLPTAVPWAVVFERLDTLPRHPAQLYEALSYLLIFAILFIVYKQGDGIKRKGLMTGLFLSLVFTCRFFIEFVKTKQAAYPSEFWMSTGQLLSLPFLLAGLALILLALSHRKSVKQ